MPNKSKPNKSKPNKSKPKQLHICLNKQFKEFARFNCIKCQKE